MAAEAGSTPSPVVSGKPLARAWRWLTQPPPHITDLDLRRKSRLLATMSVLFVLIVAISLIVIPENAAYPKRLAWALLVIFGAINVLSRSRYYVVGAYAMLVIFTAIPYYQMFASGGVAEGAQIVWGVCAVLLANLLLSRNATLLVVAVVIGFPLLVVALTPEATFITYSRDLFVIASAAILTLVFSYQRDQLEKERQTELQDLNVALEASAREAREANRLKDLFLATMSHELRTPLNAIVGYLGLMLFSGELGKDNTHMAERAMVNAERLLGLINNLLELSRIAAGRIEMAPANLSPRKMMDTLQSDLELQVKDKGLALNVAVDAAVPETIYHDQERLTQIITNLVGNAVKFTDQGRIDVTLGSHDDRLVIDVSDTGIGIPPAKQHLIFDEFMQADTGYSRRFGGAGLGLSIVKRLVILMNGSVKVSSDVAQGSTFMVELPLNLPLVVRGTGPLKEKPR